MVNYDFHTLNDYDFEILIRDLLNAREKACGSPIRLESFTKGRDKGVDLLYGSTSNPYEIVVQVKHYSKTPYSTMLSQLSRGTNGQISEVEKVKLLKPQRYLFVTSLSLTEKNKSEIRQLFTPFIKSLEDVIDQVKVNQLVSEYPDVETRHFKLWFSSVTVLQRILNKSEMERSAALVNSILQKIKLYVVTPFVEDALIKLKGNNFLVITGPPGTGKTSLAEMLILQFLSEGCSVCHIYNKIEEAEPILNNDLSCQLFYYDDFLGHTQYEIEQSKEREYPLLQFIKRIRSLRNKYLLLTTRTSILNESENSSERFRRAGIYKNKFEISPAALSIEERILLIKNHINYYNIPASYASEVWDDHRIKTIAEHKNFFPRLIEFVTDKINYNEIQPLQYYSYIITHLDNPREIWSHAYHHQLDDYDRFLLITLFSFHDRYGYVDKKRLELAFEQRIRYEIEVNHIPRTHAQFSRSYKKLLEGFMDVNPSSGHFIKHSLQDYLLYFLENDEDEKLRIANSFLYIEQIFSTFSIVEQSGLTLKPDEYFRKAVSNNRYKSLLLFNDDSSEASYVSIHLSLLLILFYDYESVRPEIISYFGSIDWSNIHELINYRDLLELVRRSSKDDEIKRTLKPSIEYILDRVLDNVWNSDSLMEIIPVFEEYDNAYTIYCNREIKSQKVEGILIAELLSDVDFEIDVLRDIILYEDQIKEAKERVREKFQSIYDRAKIPLELGLSDFDKVNWSLYMSRNQSKPHNRQR